MPRGDGGYASRLDVRALYKHDPRTRRALWGVFLAPAASAVAALAVGILAACLGGTQPRYTAAWGIMAAEALACACLYAVEAAAVGASALGCRHVPKLVRLAHDPHLSVCVCLCVCVFMCVCVSFMHA